MTELVPSQPGRVALADQHPASRAKAVAKQLRDIDANYVAPVRQGLQALDEARPGWQRAFYNLPGAHRRMSRQDFEELEVGLKDGRQAAWARRLLTAALDALPPLPLLTDVGKVQERLHGAATNGNQNRILVALMADAFPNFAPEKRETYVETLIQYVDAAGYPPAVVAAATQDIVKTKVFAPAVAEVIAACDAVAKTVRFNAEFAAEMRDCRAVLERIDRENPAELDADPFPCALEDAAKALGIAGFDDVDHLLTDDTVTICASDDAGVVHTVEFPSSDWRQFIGSSHAYGLVERFKAKRAEARGEIRF